MCEIGLFHVFKTCERSFLIERECLSFRLVNISETYEYIYIFPKLIAKSVRDNFGPAPVCAKICTPLFTRGNNANKNDATFEPVCKQIKPFPLNLAGGGEVDVV